MNSWWDPFGAATLIPFGNSHPRLRCAAFVASDSPARVFTVRLLVFMHRSMKAETCACSLLRCFACPLRLSFRYSPWAIVALRAPHAIASPNYVRSGLRWLLLSHMEHVVRLLRHAFARIAPFCLRQTAQPLSRRLSPGAQLLKCPPIPELLIFFLKLILDRIS